MSAFARWRVAGGLGRVRVADRFARYDPAAHCVEPAGARAAWLTGQSSYRHSQLSPVQLGMLDDLAGLGYTPLRAGFPYNRAALGAPYRNEPLAAAAVRNTAQYAAARFGRRFGAELVRHLRPLVGRTSRRLVLLCGSCGLEFLANAVPRLDPPEGLRILAVVLGGVGRVPPPRPWLRVYAVRADRDLISRLGSRLPPDLGVPGGHLGYAASAEVRTGVLRAAAEFLR